MNSNHKSLLFVNSILLCILLPSARAGLKLTNIHSFNDAYWTFCALVQAPNGAFYGTTLLGGAHHSGTVFKFSPNGSFERLASFFPTDGLEPFAGLVRSTNGYLYGATTGGGADAPFTDSGTIFRMTPSGKLTALVSFTGSNGRSPTTTMIQGVDGNLYGTTPLGGLNDLGTVFKMTPEGSLTTLVSFDGTNGSHPYWAPIIQLADGTLLGATSFGGPMFQSFWDGFGTLFKIAPDGSMVTLHSFDSTNGSYPIAFVLARDGNIYGATWFGGAGDWGTLFKLTPSGDFTILHVFTGNSDGGGPTQAMLLDADGKIWGGTRFGGKFASYDGFGTLFRFDTNGVFTTMYTFDTLTNKYNQPLDGSHPAGLTLARDGTIYGTTSYGGAYDNSGNGGHGTIFHLRRVRPVVTFSKRDYDAPSQQPITITGSARGVPSVTNVFLSINRAPWIQATSSNGFRTWAANVTPVSGENTVRVYAADSEGDLSRTNAVSVFCTSISGAH